MSEFKSFDSNVEVIGEVIAAFQSAFPPELIEIGMMTLRKRGIVDPQPGNYYPLQLFLNAMKDISDQFGSSMLFRIGEQIATNAVLPPGMDSIESALSAIDVAYHMNHRGGEIGHYLYSDLGVHGGLRRAQMVCPNPYPCAFDRGVIEGFAARFKPEGTVDVIVNHDDSQPCRKEGSRTCTYAITWT
jgi:hypothetical protein